MERMTTLSEKTKEELASVANQMIANGDQESSLSSMPGWKLVRADFVSENEKESAHFNFKIGEDEDSPEFFLIHTA